MNQLLFTVYDSKAEIFLPPFFVPTIGIASRAFEDSINSDDHQFGKHPQDYTLFFLGSYSQDNAEFDLCDKKSYGNGVEFLRPDELKPTGVPPNGQNQPTIPDD